MFILNYLRKLLFYIFSKLKKMQKFLLKNLENIKPYITFVT